MKQLSGSFSAADTAGPGMQQAPSSLGTSPACQFLSRPERGCQPEPNSEDPGQACGVSLLFWYIGILPGQASDFLRGSLQQLPFSPQKPAAPRHAPTPAHPLVAWTRSRQQTVSLPLLPQRKVWVRPGRGHESGPSCCRDKGWEGGTPLNSWGWGRQVWLLHLLPAGTAGLLWPSRPSFSHHHGVRPGNRCAPGE